LNIIVLGSKEESTAELSLSVSKIKTFEQCRAKYKFSYIDKLPRKEWDFLAFGSFLHEVLEDFHKAFLENPNQDFGLVMTKVFKCVSETFKDRINNEQKENAAAIIKKYVNDLYKNECLPNVLSVEKPFYIDINGKVLLNGFIDRVDLDKDGIIHVSDYKTTKDRKYLNDFFQLITYAYVLMTENADLKKVRASFILLRHNMDLITKEYSRKQVATVATKFLKYADEIAEEKLWRPNPQFLCKYCDYLDHCDEGNRFCIKKGLVESVGEGSFGLTTWC
jgi:putative RecB family exonuclease